MDNIKTTRSSINEVDPKQMALTERRTSHKNNLINTRERETYVHVVSPLKLYCFPAIYLVS